MALTNKRPCKVGKAEGFELEIKGWLESGESITSYSVTNSDGLLSIGATELDESGTNPVIKFLATGDTAGTASVMITYETTDRQNCNQMRIYVVDGC